MTPWEIFCSTGKIEDYLNYRQFTADEDHKERSAFYADHHERSGSAGTAGRR